MKPVSFVFAALLVLPSTAVAQAGDFQIVNGTQSALGSLTIRRAGTSDWRPLAAAPSPGAKSNVAFKDEDCAFDIQAKVAGSAVTWAGVNLCEVKSLTLRRDDAAGPWVDYDGH